MKVIIFSLLPIDFGKYLWYNGDMLGKRPFMPTDLCPAMREAGITDPESLDGIRFCTKQCPYDHCVIAEPMVSSAIVRGIIKRNAARALRDAGKKPAEIAEELGIPLTTVWAYLR